MRKLFGQCLLGAVSPYLEFDEAPSMEELEVALSWLKRCKAGGKTGILP